MEKVREYLRKIGEFENLSSDEMYELMKEIVEKKATPAQIGALVMGTKMKGETSEEIAGAVKLFREKVVKVSLKNPDEVVDTAGTGGDKSGTFNVSTVVGFVLAGAGIKVAKHGNRSVSSKSGSADFLEALGARIDLPPDKVATLIEEVGFGFMFAPLYHPAMKEVIGPRREVGVRSIFNLIGPLTNPAGVKRQVIGVFSEEYVPKIAEALRSLGIIKAYVVHGKEGLDEVSISSETFIAEVSKDRVKTFTFSPEELGLKRRNPEEIRVSSPEESVKVALSVLEGEKGAPRDMVLINAVFGILASEKARDIREAYELAKESVDSGKALEVMRKFVELSRKI